MRCVFDYYIINGNEVIASRVAKGTDFTDSLAMLNSGSERVKSFRKGNTEYLAFTVKSKINSWEYLAIIPQAAVMESVNVPLYWAVLLFLAGVVTSLVIACILFWSNYKPLKTLVERLNGFFPAQRKEAEPQNEYSLIDQAFQHVVANENSLQNKLEFYYPMAVHSFFTKLLYETVAVADYQAVTKSLGIDLLQNTWTVAVLYSEERNEDGSGGRSKAAKWQLGDLPVYSVEVDQNRYAIIINTAEQALVAAAVNAVRADYASGEGIRSIIGIGNPFEGLPHIGKSYREALCAVNYSANMDSMTNGIVYYRDIETNRTLGYRIPKEVEDELQKLLRAGGSQALKRYLDPFMEQSARRVGAGPVSVQVFFYSLLSIALKAAANGELPMSSLIDEQRLMTMNSTAEVKAYISNVYMLVCESLHTEKHGHCQKIRTDILNFVDRKLWRDDLDDKITAVRDLAREFHALLVPLDGAFNAASAVQPPEFWQRTACTPHLPVRRSSPGNGCGR